MLLTLSYWPNQGRNWRASRTEPKPQLTDEQWLLIEDLFPVRRMKVVGGRPPIPPRPCLEGILWVLSSGARWKDLPTYFPSPATCWRRLREWTQSGIFQIAWRRLLRRLDGLKSLRLDEAMADGTFSPAKKGGFVSARRSAAREPRSCSSSTAAARRSAWTSPAPVLRRSSSSSRS